MNNFKRVLTSSTCFVIIIVVISVVLITPYINSEFNPLFDKYYKKELSGSIDTLYLGASHALRAFIPSLIDENVGSSSYNLSGPLTTWAGRKAMLEEELERNNIKTVYLEISIDTFSNISSDTIEGNKLTIPRLSSFKKRVQFFKNEIPFRKYDEYYSVTLSDALWYYIALLSGKSVENVNREYRGFSPIRANDVSLTKDAVIKYQDEKIEINQTYNGENLEIFDNIVEACRRKNIELIIIVTPVSDSILYTHQGWNEFSVFLNAISKKYNCKCYDFNLLKERFSLFHDEVSFFDDWHLSENGAETFSCVFSKIVDLECDGEDISPLFYDSYNEMIQYSPYNS